MYPNVKIENYRKVFFHLLRGSPLSMRNLPLTFLNRMTTCNLFVMRFMVAESLQFTVASVSLAEVMVKSLVSRHMLHYLPCPLSWLRSSKASRTFAFAAISKAVNRSCLLIRSLVLLMNQVLLHLFGMWTATSDAPARKHF